MKVDCTWYALSTAVVIRHTVRPKVHPLLQEFTYRSVQFGPVRRSVVLVIGRIGSVNPDPFVYLRHDFDKRDA